MDVRAGLQRKLSTKELMQAVCDTLYYVYNYY